MSWRWPFTILVFGTILVAVYIMYLTERNKSQSATYRRREGRFKPDWGRTRSGTDPSVESQEKKPPRRRIRIRR